MTVDVAAPRAPVLVALVPDAPARVFPVPLFRALGALVPAVPVPAVLSQAPGPYVGSAWIV